jgi:predicted TIM-barrel fold metal-dependent hydrolase
MEASLYADAVRPFEDETRRLRPAAAEVIDAHTHLGLDEDGRSLDPGALLSMLDAAGAQRACVFPLHDPERHPAYRIPNDRVLGWAAESEGRLVPFCRLDPADDPLREGERCLAAGARGIKLHPRAQAFAFAGASIDAIFSLADQARVPILIHAGRGLPPIADGLADLALRHPDVVLILAHAAIADQAVLTSRLADHPGVLYDISCFSTVDVLELFARAPAERVVFASDPPYGYPATSLYAALRVAHALNLDENTTRLFLGGTMASLIDGHGLPVASPPRGSSRLELSGPLLRIFNYCTMSGPAMFQRDIATARGPLDLALATCRDPHPGAAGPALADIGRALSAAVTLLEDEGSISRSLDLVHRCMSRAVTEPV